MTVLEKEIERQLVTMVKEHGGLCLKWVCPGWAGVPDRILLLPGGRVRFVETKKPKGGVPSDRQKWWARKLGALGFHCSIVWNREDIYTLEMLIEETPGG